MSDQQQWWAVYCDGEPCAAYPRKAQAEVYASAFSKPTEIRPMGAAARAEGPQQPEHEWIEHDGSRYCYRCRQIIHYRNGVWQPEPPCTLKSHPVKTACDACLEERRKLAAALEQAEARAARLQAALAEVEWVEALSSDGVLCPWCSAWRHDGHTPNCSRQLALQVGPGADITALESRLKPVIAAMVTDRVGAELARLLDTTMMEHINRTIQRSVRDRVSVEVKVKP